jgi:hypothetical protein
LPYCSGISPPSSLLVRGTCNRTGVRYAQIEHRPPR